MKISTVSNNFVSAMLIWLKGLANWVLRLFNLAGSSTVSPLEWLSEHWLKLLIFLMLVGVCGDIVVWLLRWRPHWVWFHKERIIVNDESFFADKEKVKTDDGALEVNWEERDFVVETEIIDRPNRKTGVDAPKREKRGKVAEARHRAAVESRAKDIDPEKLFDIDTNQTGAMVYNGEDDQIFRIDSDLFATDGMKVKVKRNKEEKR